MINRQMKSNIFLAALPFAAWLWPDHGVRAAEPADLAGIDRQVARFVQSQGADPAGLTPVDRRLRLSPCPQALSLGWFGAGRSSVLVQCPALGGWRLFVPMRKDPDAPGDAAVARGDRVTIMVRGEHFHLTDQGIAMARGRRRGLDRCASRAQGCKAAPGPRGSCRHGGDPAAVKRFALFRFAAPARSGKKLPPSP